MRVQATKKTKTKDLKKILVDLSILCYVPSPSEVKIQPFFCVDQPYQTAVDSAHWKEANTY